MAVKIPLSFNSIDQGLDSKELYIKNVLYVNIDNWAKFRWAIHVGNQANVLRSLDIGSISKEVKTSYIELAKSHYEVVASLGCMKISVKQLLSPSVGLEFHKNVRDFYFHVGRMLDNLSRIIYIINDKNCSTEVFKKSKKLKRHWIDWGSLDNKYNGYKKFKSSKILKQIICTRNTITHSWSFPIDMFTGTPRWPLAIRNNRDLYWPYDELGKLNKCYKKWIPILDNVRNDYEFLEQFQDQVFKRLTKDIKKFEKNHNILIT